MLKDYAQAAIWFRKAAEQGNANAELLLGTLYHFGQGVTLDNNQAAAWYRKAAEQGAAVAQYSLGLCYALGSGVQQSNADAYFWLNLAAAGDAGTIHERAAKSRDTVASKLTPEELSDVQKQVSQWFISHPK